MHQSPNLNFKKLLNNCFKNQLNLVEIQCVFKLKLFIQNIPIHIFLNYYQEQKVLASDPLRPHDNYRDQLSISNTKKGSPINYDQPP